MDETSEQEQLQLAVKQLIVMLRSFNRSVIKLTIAIERSANRL